MDQHAHGDPHAQGGGRPEARAARSHGTVEPERGATVSVPEERAVPVRAERAAPATVAIPGTTRRIPVAVALAVIAALGFGCYTIWMDHTNGAKGAQAALLGLIAAVVTGALGVTLVHFQSSMLTETRALAYGALFGASMGWLYSLGGSTPSVLKSTAWGLVMFAVMFVVSLYAFRTHRVREPHGLHRFARPLVSRHRHPHTAQ